MAVLKACARKDVTVRSVVCFDNHRQGMSVTSVQNLLVEGCSLTGTSGTAPESGVDIEPDSPDQRLVNCVFRNCLFENNSGNAAAIYLKNQTSESEPVSITFENCVARMGKAGDVPDVVRDQGLGGWGGFAIGAIRDKGPKGMIELINCVTENTGREGARIYDNSSQSVRLRFVRMQFQRPLANRSARLGQRPQVCNLHHTAAAGTHNEDGRRGIRRLPSIRHGRSARIGRPRTQKPKRRSRSHRKHHGPQPPRCSGGFWCKSTQCNPRPRARR